MAGMRRAVFFLPMLVAMAYATKPALKEGNQAMQIKFTRSGGFAGAATNVAGAVEWTGNGVHVTAEGTAYHRDLPAAEAQQLEAAADPSALSRAQRASPEASTARDAFQYNITVITRDGKAHAFIFTGLQSRDQRERLPGVGSPASLPEWVEQETQRIWAFRVNARK
jgi:hypothetical protein